MKHKYDYSITFACYNEVKYTKKCIDSMINNNEDLSRLVIVDNGSTDGTQEYLKSINIGKLILNKANLGCGVAWNQGALEMQSEWSIIMNNDILVSKNWINDLIGSAIDNNLRVISPAIMEGRLDRDFEQVAIDAKQKIGGYVRFGDKHAVCLAVHNSVWDEVGYFRATPSLLGYEDTLFFHDLKSKDIQTGITGSSWIYHFGSVTQSAMKREQGLSDKDSLANRNNSKLLKQNWFLRKYNKIRRQQKERRDLKHEIDAFGISVHGKQSIG